MTHSVAKCVVLLVTCMVPGTVGGGQPTEYAVEILCCNPTSVSADDPAFDACCYSERKPDWRGRRSDTYHFLAYQFGAIAILYTMPESVSGWTDEQKEEYSLSQWWENVTHPRWDTDDLYINYILHPYWGAAYFVRSRERGFNEVDSFWYSAALSASYEFGAEALFEQPSIQDLIVTPVGGWFVGRYFMRVREDILAGRDASAELPFRQRFILTMTDPLGAINRTVDRWFGRDQRFNVQPYVRWRTVRSRIVEDGPDSVQTERMYGVTFTYEWR